MTASMTVSPIIFLHIPKTAGQAVHRGLVRLVGGADQTSPVRTHTQAAATPQAQMPPGYRLYSGHLDWTSFDHLPAPRFVFTVLRDPRERIASFYFYLQAEARRLRAQGGLTEIEIGKIRALDWTADAFFTGGDADWQSFVHDHFDNFYCSYFATRQMRGHSLIAGLPEAELQARAQAGLQTLDAVYATPRLDLLESDLMQRFGQRIALADRYVNTGPHQRSELRWPKLMALLRQDSSRQQLEAFVRQDAALLERIGLDISAPPPPPQVAARLKNTLRRLWPARHPR